MKIVKLKDVAKITTGKTPSKATNIYYLGGTIPFVKPPNLIGSEEIVKTEEYITVDGAKQANIIPKHSIMVSCIGSLGKVGIAGTDLATNQQINSLSFDPKLVNYKYGYYFSLTLSRKLKYIANSAVVPIVNKTAFSNLDFLLASLEEQKNIVKILDVANALRQKRKQTILLLDEYLKSIFLEMFGDPLENEKMWDVKKLKDISIKILSGSTPKGGNQTYVKEGVLFLRSQNVWRNKLDLDNVAFISEKIHNQMRKSSLEYKDILMTKTGRINTENSSLGRASIYLGENNRANINGHVYLIRLKKDIVHEFVLYILTTKEYREYIRKICVGGIDKRQINKTHLEEFPIISPPCKLQNKFVQIIHNTELLKQKMFEQSVEFDNQFYALMQKYFGS